MEKRVIGISAGTVICEEDGFMAEMIPNFTTAADTPFPNTENLVGFYHAVSKLSVDAREIVELITTTPVDLHAYLNYGGQESVLTRSLIFKFLKYRRKWAPQRIRTAFQEIRLMLAEL